jgi:hypothetical protein
VIPNHNDTQFFNEPDGNSGVEDIFDQQSEYNQKSYAKKDPKTGELIPNRLACGSVALDRERELFGKNNVHRQPQTYFNAMPRTAGKPLSRDDLTYDPARMLRARTAVRNLLNQGKAVRVGCLHHPDSQNGPFPQPYLDGGHYALIVGCKDQLDSFLCLDPWFGGSKLVTKGA